MSSTRRGLEQGDMQELVDIYAHCEIKSEVRRVTLIPRQRSISAAPQSDNEMLGVMDAL